jgi:V/A-type H+-transporting ATPase subunit D
MSNFTPTRSIALELKDERRAMRDGYVFLDEKCLLLAGEILRELERHDAALRLLLAAYDAALAALQMAIARHGLHGLQVYSAQDVSEAQIPRVSRTLMGVSLQDATWDGRSSPAAPSCDASPEAEACRRAFADVLEAAVSVAAAAGNLERLSLEYRRSVRRARALQDVLLPEIDRDVAEVEARLEELEQEDGIWMRSSR